MARIIKAVEKKERALGVKLFLKAYRCSSPKCAMIRKPYRPGQHGQKKHILTEYGRQLLEKQKIKFSYGLTERQMKNLFKKYEPNEIIRILETRLDRTLVLLGLAPSLRMARQLVSHGHVLVNNRKVTIPSFNIKLNDVIKIKEKILKSKMFEDLNERLKNYEPPVWLKLDKSNFEGKCVNLPQVEDIQFPFNIDLVVQFYSR